MRRIFGFTILNKKEADKIIKQLNYMQSVLTDHDERMRDIRGTFDVNATLANKNFKSYAETINSLVKRCDALDKMLHIITKNN